MRLFRLSRKKHTNPLSGRGAALAGGRWNSAGVEVLYTASNRSLAMAEVLVHFSLAIIPSDFQMIELEILGEHSFKTIDEKKLPALWNMFPPLFSTQNVGDTFVNEGSDLLLKVPSAVVKGDFNWLINPKHPDFNAVKLISQEDFPFDQRLFKST